MKKTKLRIFCNNTNIGRLCYHSLEFLKSTTYMSDYFDVKYYE